MAARNRARYLAPIALGAAIFATYLVAHSALTKTQGDPRAHGAASAHVAHRRFGNATFYVVQSGDSMTSIAVKTGVPLYRLEALNPGVDPNSLQTAQRIRLRR